VRDLDATDKNEQPDDYTATTTTSTEKCDLVAAAAAGGRVEEGNKNEIKRNRRVETTGLELGHRFPRVSPLRARGACTRRRPTTMRAHSSSLHHHVSRPAPARMLRNATSQEN